MNSRSAPVAPGTQQALNTCVLFGGKKKVVLFAILQNLSSRTAGPSVLFAVMSRAWEITLMGAPSVTSPRNITESSDMTAQVSAVGTSLFPGQFEMNIRVGRTQQEVI